MANLSAPPRPRRSLLGGLVDARRVSKPQLARLILTATAFVIALVLLIWLLLWLTRPRGGVDGFYVAQRGLATPVVAYQADDLQRIARGARRDAAYPSVESTMRARLAAVGSRPVVLYLSAVGVSDTEGGYLLRPDPGSLQAYAAAGARQDLLTVDRLIDLVAEAPSRRKLLILDAGQVGSDRNLGLFGNGFPAALRAALEARKPAGLAILCACAPGQTSWSSETDGRSVFGYYVAQGLSGKAAGWDGSSRGLTVHALANYVRHQVARWVAANRQAEQTPELLGDARVNFALSRITPSRSPAPAAKDESADAVVGKLDEGWARRDALEKRAPYRHTPLLWRQYLESLLRAERLIRAGETTEADELLADLRSLETRIGEAAGGLPLDPAWSLALLEKARSNAPTEARQKALETEQKSASEALDAAFQELSGGTEEAAEPTAVEASEATPPPETLPTESDSSKKAAGAVKTPKPSRPPAKASRPSKPKPGGVSSLAALLAKNDNVPLYVESQLLVWSGAFTRRGVAPYGFKGQRGELLLEALQARRLAEESAAADERVSQWSALWVEAGDTLRRRAQDGLFAGDVGRFESLGRLLEQARAKYREALDVANRCGQALDLVDQLEAELPYYGEWRSRRGARGVEGLDNEFLALLKSTAALARLLDAGPAASGESSGDEEALSARLGRVKEVESLVRDVRGAFERLQADFQAHCAGLAASAGAGRWRELNAALAVPFIPVATRRPLLQRVRSAAVAGSLDGGDGPSPSATSTTQPSDLTGALKQQTEKIVAAERQARSEGVTEAVSESANPSTPDPDFWRQALGLARLEWGMLEIGGISETAVGRLSDSYESARSAVKADPAVAFPAFAKLSELIRVLRAEQVQAIRKEHGTTLAPLVAADRAARALPLADTLGRSDEAATALDRFQRQALLVWHGRRLLLDFAPDHAQRLFDTARKVLETEDVRAANEQAAALRRAKLALRAEPSQAIRIREWADQPLSVSLSALGDPPPGDATLLLGYDPAQPLSAVEKASQHSAREGTLVPVRAGSGARQVEYAVRRTESSRDTVTAGLTPMAFYRGRFFPAEGEVLVTLDPAHDAVSVTIQQAYERLKFKDFTDQFKEHPGQGYLHYGTNLQYKLVLTSDRPVRAVVRYGLKEHPESFKTETRDLSPKKPGEIIDVIKGDDFPIVKAEELLNVAPLNLLVTVWKDRENGDVQCKRRYTFRMIPPAQYISTGWEFFPDQRVLYLYATHLATDPVTGPVEVIASIGGSEQRGFLRRSRIGVFAFRVPTTVKKVRWRVGVEAMPAAFVEEVETPLPPGAGNPPPPQ